MKKILTLLVIFLLFCSSAITQEQSTMDSLKKVLLATKSETDQVILLKKLCHDYASINPDSSIQYGLQDQTETPFTEFIIKLPVV